LRVSQNIILINMRNHLQTSGNIYTQIQTTVANIHIYKDYTQESIPYTKPFSNIDLLTLTTEAKNDLLNVENLNMCAVCQTCSTTEYNMLWYFSNILYFFLNCPLTQIHSPCYCVKFSKIVFD
jgi:hypothetical protein